MRASIAALFLVASCRGGAERVAGTAPGAAVTDRDSTHGLVSCTPPSGATTTADVGPLGGVLSVGGVTVTIPESAVTLPTQFTLRVPAGPLVEFEVVTSTSEHYQFPVPVTVSVDYGSLCGQGLDAKVLSVWNIDPDTKALLENMGGVDDKLLHVITFVTTHFSGYAVAD